MKNIFQNSTELCNLLFLTILLFFSAAGCISSEVPAGSPGQYELPGINNTTIYYLNTSAVKVVDSISGETKVKYMLDDNIETNFRDPVAVSISGENVSFNPTSEIDFGRSYIMFNFSSEFYGFVGFTQSDGQDFTRATVQNRSVRVVLPPGHTTGFRFIGVANPEPDNVTTDALGREVLTWDNPFPSKISVRHYHKSATTLFLYFSMILMICFVLISGYYYFTIRSLKKKRSAVEDIHQK